MKKMKFFPRVFILLALVGLTFMSCETNNQEGTDEITQLNEDQIEATLVFEGKEYNVSLIDGDIATPNLNPILEQIWDTGFVLNSDDKFYLFETEEDENAFINAQFPVDVETTGDVLAKNDVFDVLFSDVRIQRFGLGGGAFLGDNATITASARRLASIRSTLPGSNRNMNDIVSFSIIRNPTGSRYRVTYFQHNNFRGRRLSKISRPRFQFGVRENEFIARGINNTTSSIRIQRL